MSSHQTELLFGEIIKWQGVYLEYDFDDVDLGKG